MIKITNNFFIAALLVSLISCGSLGVEGGSGGPKTPEGFRVINAARNSGSVRVDLGEDAPFFVDANGASAYVQPQNGKVVLNVTTEDDIAPTITEEIEIKSGEYYTYLVYDEEDATSGITTTKGVLLTDDLEAPVGDKLKLQVINAAYATAAVDVFIERSGESFSDSSVGFSGVAFKAASDFISIPAGDYKFRFTETGVTQKIVDVSSQEFNSGSIVTLVLFQKSKKSSAQYFGTAFVY
ncbi:MAG: DUF4397 domain-containing protein [Proteobacteria bacterium]|nr:DUF4397 domain-containing protein [Pseudomonadota bacterium]